MKKRWIISFSVVAVYLLSLQLLVMVESVDTGAFITSMADALWFSLVTITTAGYGDVYPVTPQGRIIGTFFLLLSTGYWAAIVAAAFSLVTGRLLPWFRLRLVAHRPRYIFSALNRKSAALAAALAKEQPSAVLIFDEEKNREKERLLAGISWYRADRPLWQLLRRYPDGSTLIALDEEERENYLLARKAASLGIPACCKTDFYPETIPAGLILFDYWEGCARLYWQKYPLRRDEEKVVFLGSGQCAAALLVQSLLVNLYDIRQQVCYYLTGDWTQFRRQHPCLDAVLAVDEVCAGRDSLFFCAEPWDADFALLASADRIILCGDKDEENLTHLRDLKRWIPLSGRVDIRLSTPIEGLGARAFGGDDELFTPAIVLRTGLDHLAMCMHEIYRQSADRSAPMWEELGGFLRRSNLAAADHLATKVRVLLGGEGAAHLTPELCRRAYERWRDLQGERKDFYRELEHLRWMRFYALHNWRFAAKRDNALRFHSDMRPYEELTPAEQAKDDYAWELLAPLSEELARKENKGEGK